MWLALIIFGAVVLGGCQTPDFGAYPGATTQGKNEFRLWQGSVIAAIAIGLLVWVLIFWAIIRYRKKDERLPKQTRENVPIELIYTITPVILVAVLFFFTVIVENRIDALPPARLDVKVTAFQWGWDFNYPAQHTDVVGNYNSYPQMVLPVGEDVQITLVSNDVTHSFYVPAFNFSRMALPGVVNKFDFHVTQVGTYVGRCNQYCGLYHSQMRFSVKAVSQSEFQAWASSHGGKAAA